MAGKVRTVRTSKTKGEMTKPARRTLEELLAVNVDVEVLAANLTEEELLSIVERAGNLNREIKAREPELDRAKKLLMANAKLKGWKSMVSDTVLCKIKPKTTTIVDTMAMVRKLVALKKKHLFAEVFKVQLTKAKDYIGAVEVDEISEKKKEDYGSVNLTGL